MSAAAQFEGAVPNPGELTGPAALSAAAPSRSIDAVWTSNATGFHWIRRGADRAYHRPEDRHVVDANAAAAGLRVRWDSPNIGKAVTSYPLEALT